MVYHQESSQGIISKVYRDFAITMSGWEANAIEWIGEVLDSLGNVPIFEPKTKEITVSSFRAAIPCDLYLLEVVEYNGCHLPYGLDTVHDRSTVSVTADGSLVDTSASLFKTNVDGSLSDDAVRYFYQVRKTLNYSGAMGESYWVKPGYIVTSFESGTIKIHYRGWPIDDKGFPLVPSNPFAKQAITWYIFSRLLMGGYEHPQFRYDYAFNQYEKYFLMAQNDMAMPSPDKFASIKNMWVRMIPNISFEEQFFIDTEKGW